MKHAIIAIATFATVLAGCHSVEGDAKKLARLQCETQKLAGEAAGTFSDDEDDVEEQISSASSISSKSLKLIREYEQFQQEVEGRYTSDEDQRKFEQAFMKALEDCK